MLYASKRIASGAGLAPALIQRAPTLVLDWETRQKGCFGATDSAGRELAVNLPNGSVLRGGDVLVLDDGSLVRIQAALQPVLQVRHCSAHGSPFDLLRAAYQLGTRQVPLELQPDLLQLEPDPALADVLRRQHLIVTESQAAFEPVATTCGEGAGHRHGHAPNHAHRHGHDDAQAQRHASAPARKAIAIPVVGAAPAHVHGPGCGHDHGH